MKRKYPDIEVGQHYNNWTVIESKIIKNKRTYWKCQCKCEKQTVKYVNDYDLKTGKSKSCGCLIHNIDSYINDYESFADYNIKKYGDDFLEKYWDYDSNIFNPYILRKSCNKIIFIKCQNYKKHGSYNITCAKFYNGSRCPFCNPRLKLENSFEAKYPEYVRLWSSKNTLLPSQVSSLTSKKIWFKCPNDKHSDFERRLVDSVNYEFRCPSCVANMNESVIQHKTRLYLESLGYTINHEYGCTIIPKSPTNNKPLPFDNEIQELKLIIEVHGEQHFHTIGWNKMIAKSKNTSAEEEFNNLRFRDKYKKEFALNSGYEYLELPYWLFNDESYKYVIADKISSVLPGMTGQP